MECKDNKAISEMRGITTAKPVHSKTARPHAELAGPATARFVLHGSCLRLIRGSINPGGASRLAPEGRAPPATLSDTKQLNNTASNSGGTRPPSNLPHVGLAATPAFKPIVEEDVPRQSGGVLIHLPNRMFMSKDISGQPTRGSALLADTVIRSDAEHSIERLVEAADEVTGVGLAIIDGQIRYVDVNRCLAALNGLPKDAHRSRFMCDVVPEIGAVLTPLILQALQSKQPLRDVKFTARVPLVNGSLRDWLASFFPVNLGGGIIRVAHTVIEITERARIEATLVDLLPAAAPPAHHDSLTSREADVLTLIGQGKTTKEIAALLAISAQTVGNHRKHICRKLDLHSTAEMAAYAATHSYVRRYFLSQF